ncbi:MAG TPA: ABC transporter permease subunit [Verrucomicrobiae bacterium]|nr:ABC transporter permease subunit [Verrucomicrobiae bacterium]
MPIVERELRVAARKRGTYWFRFFAALAVLIIWVVLVLGSGGNVKSAQLGRALFDAINIVALVFCAGAGIFLTADCVSEEKRDGTLGLLFLTDLRGYDVVLGKLAANSLHSFYALLAIFPVMALSLLMGGTTVGEFWRMILVMIATLFWSLSAGLLVSTLSRGTRQAMGGMLLLVLLFNCVLPTVYESLVLEWPKSPIRPLLWASPFFTFTQSQYVRAEFWDSLCTIAGLGLVFLALASAGLPWMWRERNRVSRADKKQSERLHKFRFGDDWTRKAVRARSLLPNPFFWLAIRDRSPKLVGWLLFGSLAGLWCCLIFGTLIAPAPIFQEAFSAAMFLAFGLHLIFKYMVATEATRRFSEDHHSGALELILITPLSESQIMAGQRRALWRHFRAPLLILLLVNLGMMGVIRVLPQFHDDGEAFIIFPGGAAMLLLDFYALGWVGMRAALQTKKHNRAILSALARIMVLPWLILTLPFLLASIGGFVTNRFMMRFFVFWFVLGASIDLAVGWRARAKLRRGLRHVVNESRPMAPPPIGGLEAAKLEPARA